MGPKGQCPLNHKAWSLIKNLRKMPVREVLLDIDNEVWFPFLYKVRSSKLELGSIYELVTFQTGKYKCLYSPI